MKLPHIPRLPARALAALLLCAAALPTLRAAPPARPAPGITLPDEIAGMPRLYSRAFGAPAADGGRGVTADFTNDDTFAAVLIRPVLPGETNVKSHDIASAALDAILVLEAGGAYSDLRIIETVADDTEHPGWCRASFTAFKAGTQIFSTIYATRAGQYAVKLNITTTSATGSKTVDKFVAEFTKLVDATKPADAAKPANAAKPADSAKPVDTVKPSDVIKPLDNTIPASTPIPAESAKPLDTATPAESAAPAIPVRTPLPGIHLR